MPSRPKLRFTDRTPPIELWRKYPIWEHCLDEEDVEGQHEGTIRPSRARHRNVRFDHSAPFDLATTFGEATLADGTRLPAELSFESAPITGRNAGPEVLFIYFAPPSVESEDRWLLTFERIVGRWIVPPVEKPVEDSMRRHYPDGPFPPYDLENPRIFPLRVATFAPRYAGTKTYTLIIHPDGLQTEETS